jgi:hypothetical protein
MRTLIAILIVLIIGILPAAEQEDLCFEKGGTWNADDSTCIINHNITVDVDYPRSRWRITKSLNRR